MELAAVQSVARSVWFSFAVEFLLIRGTSSTTAYSQLVKIALTVITNCMFVEGADAFDIFFSCLATFDYARKQITRIQNEPIGDTTTVFLVNLLALACDLGNSGHILFVAFDPILSELFIFFSFFS